MFGRQLVLLLALTSASSALAGNFTVEFRNGTDRKLRVKTVKFDNAPPVTLNDGNGFDLNKAGQAGATKTAIYSGDGNRVIIFWDLATKEVLAMRSENFSDDFNTFVRLQVDPMDSTKFLIAVGAIGPAN